MVLWMMNQEIANRNALNQIQRVRSEYAPPQGGMNPMLAAFLGGVSGVGTGLQIGGGISRIAGAG